MKEFDISLEILKNIIEDDISFQVALKNKFKGNQSLRDCRPIVASLTGCVLRHLILLETITKDFEFVDNTEKYSTYLLICNSYFAKRLDEECTKKLIDEKISETNKNKLLELISKKDNPNSFIPENISRNSLQYTSVRFNTPEWVLKVWKHFGTSITFKILRKNLKPSAFFVRVRNSIVNIEDVLLDKSFTKTSVENILEYKSKDPLRKNGFYERGELFLERPALKMVLDKFSLKSDNSEVFIFNGNTSESASLEVLENYGQRIGINIGVYSFSNYPAISKTIAKNTLKNVNFFEANPDSMMANITNPQDLVIAYPESTNFDLIRENPDYLFHFKKEKMDEILQKQKEVLEGCSTWVADQGYLLYIVPTVSIKECRGQVVSFLKCHEDFKIVEEKQMFPFDEGQSCLYYACLKKGMDVAKNGVTPTNIISENSSSVSIQASSKN